MADNYTVKNSAGTDITIRAKEVAAGQYSPRVIPQVADADVSSGNPMPINDPTGVLLTGSVTETAPATDTASSGLNGRLQRIAQRLTSLIALLPASLGVKNSANSLAVVVASDQGNIPVVGPLTNTELRATSVVVSGPLTNFELRASPVPVVGNVAHDAVDSGSPNKVGLQARTTWPTAVADADRVNAIGDKYGRQLVTYNPRDLRDRQVTTITNSTSETTIVTAGAAGVFRDIFKLLIANSSATATTVTIRDSTAGTVVETFVVGAGQTVGFCLPSCDAMKQSSAENNWTATCGTSVASVFITALFVNNVNA